jgi:hypothetical protein
MTWKNDLTVQGPASWGRRYTNQAQPRLARNGRTVCPSLTRLMGRVRETFSISESLSQDRRMPSR